MATNTTSFSWKQSRLPLAIVVLAGLAAGLYLKSKPTPPPPAPPPALAPLQLDLAKGTRWTYSMSWQANSNVRWVGPSPMKNAPAPDANTMPTSDIGGNLDLAGRFHLDSLGKTAEGNFRLVMRIDTLSQCSMSIIDRPVYPDLGACEKELVGPEVIVDIHPHGRIQKLHFPKDISTTSMHLMQSLLLRLDSQLQKESETSWQVQEAGPSGTATSKYVREGDTLRRTRINYTKLTIAPQNQANLPRTVESSGLIRIEKGAWGNIQDDERVVVAASGDKPNADSVHHVAIDLVEVGTADAKEPKELATDAYIHRNIDDVTARSNMEKQLLEARAAGITFEEVRHGVNLPALGGTNHDWWNKSLAYLRLNPKDCSKLGDDFPNLTPSARGGFVDLLAIAGNKECQQTLTSVLSKATGLSDKAQADLLHRVASVQKPDPSTVQFMLDQVKKAKGKSKQASVEALGALVHYGADSGLDVSAALKELVDSAAKAKTSEEKIVLLNGLGNAGQPDAVATITSLAADKDGEVRAIAAEALRFTQTPQAQSALLELASDPEGKVQAAALKAMSGQMLSDQMVGSLEQIVSSGKLQQEAGQGLIDLLAPRAGSDAGKRMLNTVADDTHLSNQIRAAARDLLKQKK